MRIQLFLDQKQYSNIKEAVANRKMSFSTDSDMIRQVLFDYTEKIADLVVTGALIENKIASYKEQSSQKDGIIEALRSQIHKLNQDVEILQGNLDLKVKEKKK